MTDNITKLFEGALVLDTETTSLDFKEAEVIEYAAGSVLEVVTAVADESYEIKFTDMYKPSKPLLPEVSAITNISNRMLELCAAGSFNDDLKLVQDHMDKYEYYIAHNAFYDRQVLAGYDLKLPKELCTMRLAQRLYADDIDVKAFNLPYLRYALDLPVPDTFIAHRADADVIMTGMLFTVLVEKAIADGCIDGNADDLGAELFEFLAKPIKITKMPFGKHKGTKLNEIPLTYWQWALENVDSLQEDKPEYDADFAASVAEAVEEIFEKVT